MNKHTLVSLITLLGIITAHSALAVSVHYTNPRTGVETVISAVPEGPEHFQIYVCNSTSRAPLPSFQNILELRNRPGVYCHPVSGDPESYTALPRTVAQARADWLTVSGNDLRMDTLMDRLEHSRDRGQMHPYIIDNSLLRPMVRIGNTIFPLRLPRTADVEDHLEESFARLFRELLPEDQQNNLPDRFRHFVEQQSTTIAATPNEFYESADLLAEVLFWQYIQRRENYTCTRLLQEYQNEYNGWLNAVRDQETAMANERRIASDLEYLSQRLSYTSNPQSAVPEGTQCYQRLQRLMSLHAETVELVGNIVSNHGGAEMPEVLQNFYENSQNMRRRLRNRVEPAVINQPIISIRGM